MNKTTQTKVSDGNDAFDAFMHELEQIEPVSLVMSSVETTRKLRAGQDHEIADTRRCDPEE